MYILLFIHIGCIYITVCIHRKFTSSQFALMLRVGIKEYVDADVSFN